MRDNDHRHALLSEVFHDVQHLADDLGVERGGRFIEEHDLRLHAQRPRDGGALLLPAGEAAGVGVDEVGEANGR